jgi:hypothetical protein
MLRKYNTTWKLPKALMEASEANEKDDLLYGPDSCNFGASDLGRQHCGFPLASVDCTDAGDAGNSDARTFELGFAGN